MVKAFLSYSSKQKGFVEIVARLLTKASVEFDMMTFEAGGKNLEEIYKALDRSGVFVLFVSNESLDSAWVRREILYGEKLFESRKLKQFLPIIIDKNVAYDDKRIPEWMRDYNLKYVSKQTYCDRLIRTSIITATWELSPLVKQRDLMFVGRTAQIQEFERRYLDHSSPRMVCCIVSGLQSIGRRKFLQHVNVKSNVINENYFPHVISLNMRQSVEDLASGLFGLGYSQLSVDQLKNLSVRPVQEKVVLTSQLIHEMADCNDVLLIEDNNCIVDRTGRIVSWFKDLMATIGDIKKLVICIVSTSRVFYKEMQDEPSLYALEMPELEPDERNNLFEQLLRIEKIELSTEEFDTISAVFTGFPLQVIQTVQMLKQQRVGYVMSNLSEVVNFSKNQIETVIRNNQSSDLIRQLLIFLSRQDAVSISTICDIFKDNPAKIQKCIEQLSTCFLVEFVGGAGDYVRLNDIAKDHVQRLGETLNSKYSKSLQDHAIKAIESYTELIERDTSDYVLSIKELLKSGKTIPQEILIPSQYVNAMREVYNNEKRYKQVITLADRILVNEKFLDPQIVHEIRYWLCLALSRKRNKRLLSEVQKVDGADHHFLLGFYYRMCGRNQDAIKSLKKAIEERPSFYSASRELVQAYLNVEQYKEAYEIAESTYERKPDNAYHIQSYIRCIIHVDGAKSDEQINRLLKELKECQQDKAAEMYQTSMAQYYSNVKNDVHLALDMADTAIQAYPRNMYPYLTRLEIAYKSRNTKYIEESVDMAEKQFTGDSDIEIFDKFPYLACKCVVLMIRGEEKKAKMFFEEKVNGHFSDSIIRDLRKRMKM